MRYSSLGLFFLAIFSVLTVTLRPLAAEEAELPFATEWPLSDEILPELLNTGLVKGESVEYQTKFSSVVADDERFVNIWRYTRPRLEAAIDRARLVYVRSNTPEAEKLYEKTAFQVEVEFDTRRKRVTFRHSNPRFRELLGGIRFDLRADQTQMGFIPGQKTAGVAVVILRGSEPLSRPVAVCPREGRSQIVGADLGPAPFLLQKAAFGASGYLKGRFNSGFSFGKLTSDFFTSDNVFAPELSSDDVFGQDPDTEMRYQPSLEPLKNESVTEGKAYAEITSALRFYTSARYTRSELLTNRLWVKTAQIPEELKVSLPGRFVGLGEGPCSFLLRQEYSGLRYGRVKEVVPPLS